MHTTFHLTRWQTPYRLAATGPISGRPIASLAASFPTRAAAEAAIATTPASPGDFFTIGVDAAPTFPFGTQYSGNAAELRIYGPWDKRPAIERCYQALIMQRRAAA
ncbi:hypothetical protein IP68_12295 [Blastomonas sp. AAP25]|uniref:hypothetical protein n=1 Tax=Blastomonas sp. AAP25 TaxID=1523416 RepID=UPI0006B8ED1A|nr:hypothetical protein [Blastomonas sp. AAP25]KPF74543.1 hypothetical protein IP68_12295 [Blastomonas sp. AAP25]